MENKTIGSISVDVKCNLKIDDDTAHSCLMLLEQYCRSQKQKIEVSHGRKLDEEESYIILNFANDDYFKQEGE